ncbi:MAG: hypothetical protein ACXWUF_10420 [Methylomagnum sp.]
MTFEEITMLSFAATYQVPEDRTLMVKLPEQVQPGEHEILLVIDRPQAIPAKPLARRPGSAKGRLIIRGDDDEHLTDFRE